MKCPNCNTEIKLERRELKKLLRKAKEERVRKLYYCSKCGKKTSATDYFEYRKTKANLNFFLKNFCTCGYSKEELKELKETW